MIVVDNKNPTCIFLLIVILVGIFVSSCSFSSSETAVYNTFEEIDSLIELRDYKSAWKLLKKTSKRITNPVETLGIIKRSYILQEKDFALEYIEESLKSFPDNEELLALFSYSLINDNKYEKALPYAKKLEGTKYGSIYSELRFILDDLEIQTYNKDKNNDEKHIYLDYYSTYYAQAYADIYNSTGNSNYLKNVALVFALNGQLEEAFKYHPKEVSIYEDPFFWALISYDSHNFYQTIIDLQQKTLTKSEIELLADSYAQTNNYSEAYKIWNHSKDVFATKSPISYHNAALYNSLNDNQILANEIILELVEKFPNYVDGLSLYTHFSFLQNTQEVDDGPFSSQLANKGFLSLEMEKNLLLPELNTKSAYNQISVALPQVKKIDETDYSKLLIEQLKTKWNLSNPPLTNKQKIADIWILLEQNQKENYSYHPVLVEFATWFFLNQDMNEEADAIFTAHCTTQYNSYLCNQTEYNKQPIPNMQIWEYEFGAVIALIQERYEDALLWLEELMPNNVVPATTPLSASLNLAQIQDMRGNRNIAISIYEQILESEMDAKNRSEIYYRAAVILHEIGEAKKVLFSLEESLRENPAHSASQLLLKKLQN